MTQQNFITAFESRTVGQCIWNISETHAAIIVNVTFEYPKISVWLSSHYEFTSSNLSNMLRTLYKRVGDALVDLDTPYFQDALLCPGRFNTTQQQTLDRKQQIAQFKQWVQNAVKADLEWTPDDTPNSFIVKVSFDVGFSVTLQLFQIPEYTKKQADLCVKKIMKEATSRLFDDER